MCLGQDDDADLAPLLRAHPDDDAPLVAAIAAAIARKPKGHDFDYSRQTVHGQVVAPHEPHRRLTCFFRKGRPARFQQARLNDPDRASPNGSRREPCPE